MRSNARSFTLYSTLPFFCLIGARQALAGEGESEPATIVVTATRTAKTESEAPANVTVVTDYSPDDTGQLSTRIEAFIESIKNRKRRKKE